MKDIVVDHATYRELGNHDPNDDALSSMNRVVRTVSLASHPDKWRVAPGQPGYDCPELGWVGDIVFRRMQSIKEQWLLAEKANDVDHRGHRYYLPFPARQ
eukprot:3539726-Lingulodinium_polyedra.AAC.1